MQIGSGERFVKWADHGCNFPSSDCVGALAPVFNSTRGMITMLSAPAHEICAVRDECVRHCNSRKIKLPQAPRINPLTTSDTECA